MAETIHLQNQYLFSEAYLREYIASPFAPDHPAAAQQMMSEWREEYPDLSKKSNLLDYLSQCLSSLGFSYSRQSNPDLYLLYADETHSQVLGICLVVFNDEIGRMVKGRHYQVKLVKLLKEKNLAWGMISNGIDWRLCYSKSSTPYEVHLEARVDTILHPQKLKEFTQFYRFFSKDAFGFGLPGSNSISVQGLDQLLGASETATQSIERHLKNRVDDVLQALCLGFVNDEGSKDLRQPELDEIYRNAIYLLYRVLFLFYAEARHLLPVDEDSYRIHSLEAIIEDVQRWQLDGWRSPNTYDLWTRLANLCGIVDIGDQEAGVNAYNGGLFSDTENPYLRKHQIKNEYLAPALFYLAFMETRTGLRRIEYRDLSVRHLGTLYEGMLEYRLNLVKDEPVVVRESNGKRLYVRQSLAQAKKGETILQIGQVYFADDKGERKSSGSYYTPEDVVQYIVGQTLLPKLKELSSPLREIYSKAENDRQIAVNQSEKVQAESYADHQALNLINEKLLQLKILDPAMGSAHFLVAAGQTLTNFIIEELNKFDWPSDIPSDPLVWKRRVVERCLYGVDVNPLAQELAKLSLWLSSASVGKPLTFLDHHLKVGNSLLGAPINQLSIFPCVLKTPEIKEDSNPEKMDLIQHVYQITLGEMVTALSQISSSDSDQIEDVKGKGDAYQNALYLSRRLRDIADTWLAILYGLLDSDSKPISEDKYFNLLQKALEVEDPSLWEIFALSQPILQSAKQISGEKRFFHWEIEFPDAIENGKCQFDIVIANPPYVGTTPDKVITKLFRTYKCGDLYAWIFEQGLRIASNRATIGTIVPLSVMFAGNKGPLREILLNEPGEVKLMSFDNRPDAIFEAPGLPPNRQRTTIILCNRSNPKRSILTTSYLRWLRSERPILFDNLKFADITGFATREYFPSIGDDRLVDFYSKLFKCQKRISDYVNPKGMEYLCIPSAACYFISAVPVDLGRRNQELLSFDDERTRNLVFAIINSNVFYWYWRSRSDGFWVSRDQILSMPVPNLDHNSDKLLDIAQRIWEKAKNQPVSQKINGKYVQSYRLDFELLLQVDDWLLQQIAPNHGLPKDIFAQSKSNSFLRNLDVSAIMSLDELEEA